VPAYGSVQSAGLGGHDLLVDWEGPDGVSVTPAYSEGNVSGSVELNGKVFGQADHREYAHQWS
jgi:hypothetical protein